MTAAVPMINMIAAMCNNRGIGYKNKLPWNLKKEMAYFHEISSKTENSDKMNSVIMGRKTYESIPKKYFPLRNRFNIILSRNLSCAPPGSFLARNLDQAIDMIRNGPLKDKAEQIFITGGSSVYKELLESKYPCRIYLTKIKAEFNCDIFFPEFSEEIFPEVFGLPNVPSEEQDENGIKWTYHTYEKKKTFPVLI